MTCGVDSVNIFGEAPMHTAAACVRMWDHAYIAHGRGPLSLTSAREPGIVRVSQEHRL
jgi:hypothetical protein